MSEIGSTDGVFRVSGWMHGFGGFIERRKDLWVRLADLESRLLGARLDTAGIDRPIYISGLARSGTTILLEIVGRHPAVATHQYRDYPPVFTPFWWNWLLGYIENGDATPMERAHRDRIEVTPASPEAMEEVIWMTFFSEAHDPGSSNVLDCGTDHPAFEAFYRRHIAKLLLARGGRRYLAKGNYNVTRLQFLQRIFPGARFVLPIRAPAAHVASLVKQQRLFMAGAAAEPRALDHLRRVGHFEFGPDRRPINIGNAERTRQVTELWRRGEEVRGWARYWADLYGFVADRLAADPALRDATLVVRYEDLCARPQETILRVTEHAGLADGERLARDWAGRIAEPDYYRPDFTAEEMAAIGQETAATAARFDYDV